MADTYADTAGKELDGDTVRELAEANIRGSMGYEELLESYLTNQSDDDLVQWATDEHGEFPTNL